jgi:AraC-like DNA-binding protein
MTSHAPIVRAAELADLADERIRLVDGGTARDRLFQGHLSWRRLRSGLSLHCSDCQELQDFATQTEARPHLNFILFLQGRSEVSYDGRPFTFGASGTAGEGVTIALNEPMLFARRARRGQRIRKVSVSLAPEWFESSGFDGQAQLKTLLQGNYRPLNVMRWQPSPRLLTLAEQVLHPGCGNRLLENLYLESRALEIAGEALSLLTRQPLNATPNLRPQEYQRIRRTLELLHSGEADGWSLEDIAHEVGCCASTLQRQFQAAKGTSLFEYQRQRKLQQAREALERQGVSVGQAAWIAGYSSAANFSTAFKRAFGISPKQVRARL